MVDNNYTCKDDGSDSNRLDKFTSARLPISNDTLNNSQEVEIVKGISDSNANTRNKMESSRGKQQAIQSLQIPNQETGKPSNLTMRELIRNKILMKKQMLETNKRDAMPFTHDTPDNNQKQTVQEKNQKSLEASKLLEVIPPGDQNRDLDKKTQAENVTEDKLLKLASIDFNTQSNPQGKSADSQVLKSSKSVQFKEDVENKLKNLSRKEEEFSEIPIEKENVKKSENSNPSIQKNNSKKQLSSESLNRVKKSKLRRLATEDYESMVAPIASLDLKDMRAFCHRPLLENQVMQFTIVRDRSGIINKFYPIFHLFFSVRLQGEQRAPCHVSTPHAGKQNIELCDNAIKV